MQQSTMISILRSKNKVASFPVYTKVTLRLAGIGRALDTIQT